MTPLIDQDGNPVEGDRVELELLMDARRVVIKHDEVRFYDDEKLVAQVTRPTHPGAGLAVEFVPSVVVKGD